METIAKLKSVRLSPMKGRLVADLIRNMPVSEALEQLHYSDKKAARIIAKVLNSAIANAEHNEGADIDELRIKEIFIDQGPVYKRIKARAKGRANRILKPTSHVTIKLTDNQE